MGDNNKSYSVYISKVISNYLIVRKGIAKKLKKNKKNNIDYG